MQAATAALRQSQQADGSWNAEAHLSALALQALWLAGLATTDADAASLSGQITDAAGNPIAAAAVRLGTSAAQTTSDAHGRFHFGQLSSGPEQLDIQASGWRPLLAPLHLQAGQRLDLGAIRLSAAASSAAAVRGTARYFDGHSHYAAAGVTITVGGQSVDTDSSGRYQLDGLGAGALAIRATYAGYYPAIAAAVTAQAGQVIDFSPVFQNPPQASGSNLLVRVLDENGQPLPGATVSLGSTWASTDAQGQVRFAAADIALGSNTLSVGHSGHQSALVNFQAAAGQNITVPVMLQAQTATETTLKGVVTDAASGQPLGDVAVRLDGTALRAQTDAQGAYQISDAAIGGDTPVVLEKPGYLTHRQTLALAAGYTTAFNVPLRAAPSQTPAAASLHV